MSYRICLVSNEFPPSIGGVGQSVFRIANMLLELGYEVHVAVFPQAQPNNFEDFQCANYQTSEEQGIFVHRIQTSMSNNFSEMSFFSDCYLQLKLLHTKYSFKIFHAFFATSIGYITTLLGRENNIPVINSVRGNDLHTQILGNWHSRIVWTLENSSWTTFVSFSLLERATLFVPQLRDKSSVFYNSVEHIDFCSLPESSFSHNLKGLVIGSVGNFRYKKGINFLIESCRILANELDFTLLLIGDFRDNELHYWKQIIKNSNIENKIIVTGFLHREEALANLYLLDIFVIPSLHDGCPNTMLEAMAAGKAIIGTNVDAIGEILEDGVDAIVINPGCTTELISALQKLANNTELRHQLGRNAHRKCLEHFNHFIEKQHWKNIYEKLNKDQE